MQEPQKEPLPVPQKMPIKVKLSNLIKALGEGKNMWRARLEGSQGEHAEETLSDALRSFGVTEEGRGFFGAFLNAWRKMRRDDEAFHTVDRYLVGGMGVFDLVLIQLLVSVGHTDWTSSLSWLAFVVSLPCTVGSLFGSSSHLGNTACLMIYFNSYEDLVRHLEILPFASTLALEVYSRAEVYTLSM